MKFKPYWWPKNPYPKSIFPMERDRYSECVPDPDKRTALSGMLGREFWGIASDSIFDCYKAERLDWDEFIKKLRLKNKDLKKEVKQLKQALKEAGEQK
jgi:hypothetical protein